MGGEQGEQDQRRPGEIGRERERGLRVQAAERGARIGDQDQQDAAEARGVRPADQNLRSW
jgi:hypothetical protein